MNETDADDFELKYAKEQRREKFIGFALVAAFFGFIYWSSYQENRDPRDYFWMLMLLLGLVIYRLHKLDEKLDSVLARLNRLL